MSERHPTNSELRLSRLADAEPRLEEKGILVLFDEVDVEAPDEDAPLSRERRGE
jgi:hypothetical protein